MPWKPLTRLAFAICTHPFTPSTDADLPLQIGDELYIIEQGGRDGAWFRGYLVAPPSLLAGLTSTKGQTLEKRVFTGIFPRVCVEIRELLGEVTRSNAQSPASFDLTRNTPQAQPPSTPSPDKPLSPTSKPSAKTSPSSTHVLATGPAREPGAARPPAPVPMLKIGDESLLAKEEPLVDEIASCLREWQSTHLHELLLTRQYDLLDDFSDLVNRLDYARRQLLHKILTKSELQRIRESAVWDLVAGNKMLSGDIIVRSPAAKGRVLTGEDSATELSSLQSTMALLEKRPIMKETTKDLFHCLVDIKNFSTDSQFPTVLFFNLYKKVPGEKPKLLSESYAVDVSKDRTVISDGRAKTLFTDLSATDVGDGVTENAILFLVARITTTKPALIDNSRTSQAADGTFTQYSTNLASNVKNAGLKYGRKSVMLAQQAGRKDGDSNRFSKRPETADSHRSQQSQPNPPKSPKVEDRPRTGNRSESQTLESQSLVKRTTAVAVCRIDTVIKGLRDVEKRMTVLGPSNSIDVSTTTNETWDEIASEFLTTGSTKQGNVTQTGNILIQLKAFKGADSQILIRNTPTRLHDIQVTHRIGFPAAPTKPRSDIYVTLQMPCIPDSAFLSHPRSGGMAMPPDVSTANLQLTLEVRNASGDRIENCVFPASNSAGHTAWRTMAAGKNELWNQTVRFAVEPKDVPGCHIVMSLADSYNFPFALCWMPLWNQEAFVRDTDHKLTLYKYDEYTSSMISGKGAYLSLPWNWNSRVKNDHITGAVASLNIRTYLCSTAYSSNPSLLGLLKWREQGSTETMALLKRFNFIPEIEIVKLLNEVFDALFEILAEYAGNDEFESLVFDALVLVLSHVHDRRFNLQPLVDEYAANKFRYPFVFPCMVRSFTRLLQDPSNPERSRSLRATCKVGGHLLKFMIRARQQQIAKELEIGIKSHRPAFVKDLHEIFRAVETLMQDPSAVLIGTKTLVVQYFHTWLPVLTVVMSAEEILEIASNFINSCQEAYGKLILYKLVLINNLSGSDLFAPTETWKTWRSSVEQWMDPHWGFIHYSSIQWREQIRLCCSIVSTLAFKDSYRPSRWTMKLVDSYRAAQVTPKPASDSLSILFPSTYPFPSRSASSSEGYDEALVECSALLAETSVLSPKALPALPKEQLADLLHNVLHVCNSVLQFDAFPPSWLSAHIYHHKATMNMLKSMFEILVLKFLPQPDDADDFDTNLWRAYFSALVKLTASDALALETFPEQKRRAVWKIGGDVRELGAELLHRSWQAIAWDATTDEIETYNLQRLGGFQVQYVPGLVGPILELCLSVHEGLRSVATGVLHAMIVSEWVLSQDLTIIQAEMIGNLDRLYKSKVINDGMLQKQFLEDLSVRFEGSTKPDTVLLSAVKVLLTRVDQLLDLLVAVHSTEPTGDAYQIMHTLRLLDYLKDVQKVDVYISYVHKLAQSQAKAQNYTEAGLALRMHAELYQWDTSSHVEPLLEPVLPSQTSFGRKEQIYLQMISHFEEGNAWQFATAAYEELATQYQHNVFDFAKLARAQRATAKIYEKISRGDRQNARYYRVTFEGLGFPPSLRDKQFIFEGLPTDRIAAFTDKLMQQYPTAQVITGQGMDEIEGQYLSVHPLSAQKNFYHPVNRQIRTARPVREHFMLANPTKFANTTFRQANGTDMREQVQEKTVYTTEMAFPNILRRSEIINTEIIRLSPVEIGLERIIRKTQDLMALANTAQESGDAAFGPLTDSLSILVGAESAGCMAGYWGLLPIAPDSENPEDAVPGELSALEEALKVALIDHVYTIRLCLDLYSRSAYQATKAQLLKELRMTFAAVILASGGHEEEELSAPELAEVVAAAEPPRLPSKDIKGPKLEGFSQSNGVLLHSRQDSATKPGASERISDSTDRVKTTGTGTTTYGDFSRRIGSRLSTLGRKEPALGSSMNTTPALTGVDRDVPILSRQSSIMGMQARVGKVTKRLSTLSVRNKTSKSNVRSVFSSGGMAEVAEDDI